MDLRTRLLDFILENIYSKNNLKFESYSDDIIENYPKENEYCGVFILLAKPTLSFSCAPIRTR